MVLSPPVVNDWTARYAPTSPDFNTYVHDAFTFLQAPPVMRAVQLTSQSMAATSYTAITCDTMREDNYGGYSTVTGRYTAQVPGWYACVNVPLVATTTTGPDGGALFWYTIDGISTVAYAEGGRSISGQNPNRWEAYIEIYLNTGDWIAPLFDNRGTVAYSTFVSSTTDVNCSSFSIAWFSE